MYNRNQSDPTHLHNPAHGVSWSVNVSDDETRTMTAAEVAMAAARGELDANDTYVWREGMGDWLPLGQCSELQDVIAQYGGPPAHAGASPAPYGAPQYGADPYEDDEDLGATRVADEGLGGTLMVNPPAYEDISRTMASGVDGGYGEEEDVFASARPVTGSSPPTSSRLTGARNEESSLFSLDDLRRAADAKSAPAQRSAPPGRSAAAASSNDDPFADLLAGAGGLAFEPPPLHAPAPPPPPPPPKPQPIVTAPAVAPMSGPVAYPMSAIPEPKKSKTGLILGAVAGVVLLGGAAIAFVMAGGSEEAPQAKVDAGETKPDEAKGTDAEDGKADEADDATAKKDEPEKSDEDDKAGEADKKDDGTKTSAVTSTTADKTKKDDQVASTDKKDEPKKDEPKKDDAKKDDAPKAAGEFNRDAARSALNAAAGAASGCKQEGGPTGRGQVTVTFAPSGRATQATVGPPFAGTPVGSCAAGAFKSASVPPFTGSSVTVSKSFFIK